MFTFFCVRSSAEYDSVEQNLFEMLVVAQLVKRYPACYGTQRFIATGPYHEPYESNSQPHIL